MHRSRLEEGAPQLSAADARKKIMRAHVVALMLDAQEVGLLFRYNSFSNWLTLAVLLLTADRRGVAIVCGLLDQSKSGG